MLMRERTARGFTLVELMVTLVLLSILLALAAPSFSTWIRNTRTRTTADALQNGVRLAQAEAVRRNRQVVFFLTNGEPSNVATAAAGGTNWAIRWLPTVTEDAADRFVRGGALSDIAAGVGITGPAVICFNSIGRQVANADPGVGGVACALDPANPRSEFTVAQASPRTGDRQLRVTVNVGGQIRLCDPDKATTAPDGCPP